MMHKKLWDVMLEMNNRGMAEGDIVDELMRMEDNDELTTTMSLDRLAHIAGMNDNIYDTITVGYIATTLASNALSKGEFKEYILYGLPNERVSKLVDLQGSRMMKQRLMEKIVERVSNNPSEKGAITDIVLDYADDQIDDYEAGSIMIMLTNAIQKGVLTRPEAEEMASKLREEVSREGGREYDLEEVDTITRALDVVLDGVEPEYFSTEWVKALLEASACVSKERVKYIIDILSRTMGCEGIFDLVALASYPTGAKLLAESVAVSSCNKPLNEYHRDWIQNKNRYDYLLKNRDEV